MRMKTLILSLCLVLVVLTAAAGTIAYLTDTDEVVNSFTVGNIGMDVNESPVDENGQKVEGGTPTEGNQYHLVPGKTYWKDPYVTIHAKSEECYVRMIATITEAKNVLDVMGADFLPETCVKGWDNTVWVPQDMVYDEDANELICEFRYYETVDNSLSDLALELEPLFTELVIPGDLTNEDLKTLQNMQIKVVGHAIQAATFADEVEAWAAFTAQTGE